MRLDYVVTLKNDYTEKEMLALCEQCTDEIRNNDAIEYFALSNPGHANSR